VFAENRECLINPANTGVFCFAPGVAGELGNPQGVKLSWNPDAAAFYPRGVL